MSGRIDKLTLDCFRGASGPLEIVFDKTKTFTLIFGENGTGKSTISDAIDFVANRSFGSLQDRSLGKVRHPFVATLDRTAKDCKVEVVSEANKWTAVLSKQTVSVSGIPPQFRAMVLRRAQLLSLVEAEPAKRYAELQRFIDVAAIEDAEQQLRDALRSAEASLAQAVAVVEENEASLNDLWTKEGKPGTTALDWGTAQASLSISDIEDRLKSCNACLKALAALETAQASFVDATTDAKSKSDARSLAADKLSQVSRDSADLAATIRLLTAAKPLVDAQTSENCPLCEKAVDQAALKQSIERRLQSLTDISTLVDTLTRATTSETAAILSAERASTRLSSDVRSTSLLVESIPTDCGISYPSAIAVHKQFLADPKASLPASDLLSFASELIGIKSDLERAVTALQQRSGKQKSIQVYVKRLADNTSAANALNDLIRRMKQAVEIIEPTRKAFAQGILDEVSAEASRLYAIMHPGEPLGDLKMLMSPTRRGSIDQEATFGGKSGIPPQAYFSESHLDTLGFCVWLAVAKRADPKEMVIVLDDVFTSVDSVHLSRIMLLLNTVANDFAQLIVLTHYRTWRDRYRLNQGPGANVQLLELHRWSLPRGVRLSGTLTGVEELEQTLTTDPLNRQAVASQAGILLEAVLDRLSIQYRRRLPRNRDSEWTLGDLIGGCKKLLGVVKLEEESASSAPAVTTTITTQVQPFIDEAGPLLFIRNQVGCHFNSVGAEVADADVEAFGNATVALVKAMSCKHCGDIPDRRDGTHFRCGCKKTKMTPLEYDK